MNSSRISGTYSGAIFGFLNFDAKNSGWKSLGDGGRGAPQLRGDGPCSLDQMAFSDRNVFHRGPFLLASFPGQKYPLWWCKSVTLQQPEGTGLVAERSACGMRGCGRRAAAVLAADGGARGGRKARSVSSLVA